MGRPGARPPARHPEAAIGGGGMMDLTNAPADPVGALRFRLPLEIVHAPHLDVSQKRALLAYWASDACAVEGAPALRHAPGTPEPVAFDAVMQALLRLDRPEPWN